MPAIPPMRMLQFAMPQPQGHPPPPLKAPPLTSESCDGSIDCRVGSFLSLAVVGACVLVFIWFSVVRFANTIL